MAGHPWITKLPFPVHVVEKVTVLDQWRESRFTTIYSYHHGYFDGIDREFRGFGRVEQTDVEDFGTFATGNTNSPYISNAQTLYQPPVKTITWFHTGAFLDRERILNQFQDEYFAPQSDRFAENQLPEPDLASLDLSAEEWREALRAGKGMMLRQEIYELDVDALARGEEQRVKLFSTAFHNCHIQQLQHRGTNRHAVFLVTESEAITYHYELDLRSRSVPLGVSPALQPDPRITHTLNLRTDEYENVLESVKTGLWRCLKSGVNPDFPHQGTPQGGVISPLLANIALDGIEDIHKSIRYADDMVFILKPNDNATEVLTGVRQISSPKRLCKPRIRHDGGSATV